MPRRKIRISHSAGSERILSDDEESSSGTGIQVSPSDESQEYSDSVPEEEEWTPVDIFDDDEIEPSDSASRPSSKPPRPLRHRSNHHRQPRPSSYHHSSHRSVAEEHTARRPSYRKHRESHSYREHRDHRRPPSVHSDSLDSHDDYPGYARGPPLPHHPHHQWSHVPSHGPPGGYGGSMVSSGGYNPFTGGMSHPSTQLVSLSSHPDMYGYPPPNPFSPSAHSQPNPFSPAASSASGATGYFDHHRGAYGRGTHPPRHGEMMPYGAHAGAGPYQYPYGSSMYYYAGAHADSPPPPPHPHPHPPPPRSYSRPGSVPQEPGKGKEDDEVVAKLEKLILEQNQKAAEAAPKKEEEDKFTKLEKLIMLQKEDQIAREKAAEEKAAKEKADAEAKVAKEAAEKKAAEEAAKALVDAAAIARAEAEIKAKGEAAKAKEEHDKKVKELEVAAAEAIKKAEALKGPDDDKMPPIKFKDAVGRKFRFPWKICKTWQVSKFLLWALLDTSQMASVLLKLCMVVFLLNTFYRAWKVSSNKLSYTLTLSVLKFRKDSMILWGRMERLYYHKSGRL